MIWISTADTLNYIAYEGMIENEYPKLDVSIIDKIITSTEKQRRVAPIKPTNTFIKQQVYKNTQFRRR